MAKQTLELRVQNLDCEHDARALERAIGQQAGVDSLRVLPKAGRVTVAFDPGVVSASALRQQLAASGFPPRDSSSASRRPALWRNPKVVTSAIAGLLVLGGWIAGRLEAEPLSVAAYVAAMAIGGYYFGREGIEELLFEREIGIELLMMVAAVTAALLGAPEEGAILVFLYSMSEAAEGYTEEKTRSAVRALMDLTPKRAVVRRDGQDVEVPIEEVVVGDIFLVKPGQAVATDGEVVTGTSSVNQAPVTGESIPVEKQPGDDVFAGSINAEGALEVRATRTAATNTIARIIQMVEEAQERKGTQQRFVERFGKRYSPAVLLAGILLAVVPVLVAGGSWSTWLERATVFIVAAAPCALVISVPISMVAALGTGARNGVLIKGGIYLEELARVRVLALDKTGTLTYGEPEVATIRILGAVSERDVLAVAAGLERASQHPLARAVMKFTADQGVLPAPVEAFQSLTGAGVTASWEGRHVYLGSPEMFSARLGQSLEPIRDEVARLQEAGHTVVLVGTADAVWGWLAIRDRIREDAAQALDAMHKAGIQRIVMLTGDNERTARAVAAQLGIDEVRANLTPEDKLRVVRELRAASGHLAMVGDGVNDAPALAEASVGIAMGTAGTDVALETADVALMGDNLERLVYARHLATRTQRIVRQNLVLSVIVIAVLVGGAIAGMFSLPAAVIGHEVSEFVVIGSGLRLLRT
jgi:Zn2+/Cd2+-exporting ATPase